MNNILDYLADIYSIFKEEYSILGLFLYGSQNYQLNTESSDIDCIMIIQSLDDLVSQKSHKGSIIKIYSLKTFIKRLLHYDLECHECLFTKYKLIKSDELNTILHNCESVIDNKKIELSLYRKLEEHTAHVFWMPYGAKRCRYNKKRLYWAMRVAEQLKNMQLGQSFQESLVYPQRKKQRMLNIKSIDNYLTLAEITQEYNCLLQLLNNIPRGGIRHDEDFLITKLLNCNEETDEGRI